MKAVLFLLLLSALTTATATDLLRGRSDPKTVETKKSDDLRYLFFGTSITFGSCLTDMNERFSYLMSPNSTNVAIPGGQSPYPARCCYTMVGESEIYDVIVLEWSPMFFETTIELAKRLRQRFPNAYIIVLEMWALILYNYIPTGQSLDVWLTDKNMISHPEIHPHSAGLMEYVQEQTSPEDWSYSWAHSYLPDQINQFGALGAHMIKVPAPVNVLEAMMQHGFFADFVHLSPSGHIMVANLIQEELQRASFSNRQNEVSPWKTKDQCESWLETAQTTIQHDPSMKMLKFSKKGKYSLEISGEGWMLVTNKQDTPADLYIDYMATHPDCLYPKMEITIGKRTAVADPCFEALNAFPIHVTQALYLGSIPTGETMMRFRLLETDKERPFRLVGIMITPDIVGKDTQAAKVVND